MNIKPFFFCNDSHKENELQENVLNLVMGHALFIYIYINKYKIRMLLHDYVDFPCPMCGPLLVLNQFHVCLIAKLPNYADAH